MRPDTWTLLLPSKVSSPTPLCPVKTDCLLTLLVRGNVLFQFGELRSWIQAEQLEVDCQLHLSAMSPWTSHWTSLGPFSYKIDNRVNEAHPWVVQNSHYSMEKQCWSASNLRKEVQPSPSPLSNLGASGRLGHRIIHPAPPPVLAHPSTHILGTGNVGEGEQQRARETVSREPYPKVADAALEAQ